MYIIILLNIVLVIGRNKIFHQKKKTQVGHPKDVMHNLLVYVKEVFGRWLGR